jgi:asparagine synthase (glutamine-hydrolysing)
MDYIRRILLSERSLNRGYFQPAYIRRILTEHVDGRVNHRLLIWSLLSFEWWNRIFMDGESYLAREAVDLPSISPEPGLSL